MEECGEMAESDRRRVRRHRSQVQVRSTARPLRRRGAAAAHRIRLAARRRDRHLDDEPARVCDRRTGRHGGGSHGDDNQSGLHDERARQAAGRVASAIDRRIGGGSGRNAAAGRCSGGCRTADDGSDADCGAAHQSDGGAAGWSTGFCGAHGLEWYGGTGEITFIVYNW